MSVGFGHIFAYFVYYYFPFSDNRPYFLFFLYYCSFLLNIYEHSDTISKKAGERMSG